MLEVLQRLTPDQDPLAVLIRMEVKETAVQLGLKLSALAPEERETPIVVDRVRRLFEDGEALHPTEGLLWIHLPRRLKFRDGRAWLSGEAPKRARADRALIKALRRSHDLLAEHSDEDGVMQQSPPTVHERNLVRLAWLAPDLQGAILDGRQKQDLCLEDFRHAVVPLCWDDQRTLYGS